MFIFIKMEKNLNIKISEELYWKYKQTLALKGLSMKEDITQHIEKDNKKE